MGGGFANETVTGSWPVNSDCTNTVNVNIYESGDLVRTSVLAAVFVGNSSKIRAVQESLTLPDGTPIPGCHNVRGGQAYSVRTAIRRTDAETEVPGRS